MNGEIVTVELLQQYKYRSFLQGNGKRRLFETVEHFALHSVLQLSAPNHEMNHFEYGSLGIFLKRRFKNRIN